MNVKTAMYYRLQSCKHLFWEHLAWYDDEAKALEAVRGMIRTDDPQPPYMILTEFVSSVPPEKLPTGPDWSRGKRPKFTYYQIQTPSR